MLCERRIGEVDEADLMDMDYAAMDINLAQEITDSDSDDSSVSTSMSPVAFVRPLLERERSFTPMLDAPLPPVPQSPPPPPLLVFEQKEQQPQQPQQQQRQQKRAHRCHIAAVLGLDVGSREDCKKNKIEKNKDKDRGVNICKVCKRAVVQWWDTDKATAAAQEHKRRIFQVDGFPPGRHYYKTKLPELIRDCEYDPEALPGTNAALFQISGRLFLAFGNLKFGHVYLIDVDKRSHDEEPLVTPRAATSEVEILELVNCNIRKDVRNNEVDLTDPLNPDGRLASLRTTRSVSDGDDDDDDPIRAIVARTVGMRASDALVEVVNKAAVELQTLVAQYRRDQGVYGKIVTNLVVLISVRPRLHPNHASLVADFVTGTLGSVLASKRRHQRQQQ